MAEAHGFCHRPGAANCGARLTDEQVAEMRGLYASGGYTLVGLARRFGVSDVWVAKIVRREAWRHV